MNEKKRLGLALCGSYCTYDKLFAAAERLRESYELIPIMSETAAETDTRFGAASVNIRRLMELTGREVITTIADAEPLGPAKPLDALLIAPCTGNTLAKIANGVSDSVVSLAVKAHLRNERPVLIAISSNDALSGNAKNLGVLMNTKNIFFVPFGQDDPAGKPNSLVADFSRIGETAEAALSGEQLQPILLGAEKKS